MKQYCLLFDDYSFLIDSIRVLIEVMIGACFPRDKFMALILLVVFGLDVSSDFRLALAFPVVEFTREGQFLYSLTMYFLLAV